jgi:protoporphyrinogen oxidase
MPKQKIRKVAKKSFISFAGRWVDFPFQKNIHQLPRQEFIDCLYDLYFARAPGMPERPEANFKEMLFARFGRAIAEKFLIPYNEKLYATDLAKLDRDAMGRFFPHAELGDIIRNMKQADSPSYNASFTYPEGGAIEYVNALASEVDAEAIHLEEGVRSIDLDRKVVRTDRGEYGYERLISTMPFPVLLELCGLPLDGATWGWNQVLVFNFGFDAKGPSDVHWVYYPSPERSFYRVGFYDNIIEAPRMSLYVEVGFPSTASIGVAATRKSVLDGLRAEGVVKNQRLIAEHFVVMNPAYVHITKDSSAALLRAKQSLSERSVYSIGRYGSWTYCSIEDNIVEARRLVTALGAGSAWTWSG